MYTGFYSAASGLIANSRAVDVVANNLANADTAGYKKDFLITTSFGEHMLVQNGTALGAVNFGVRPDITHTSFEQGGETVTGCTLDLLIRGEGFFTILLPDGTTRLTRNGQFELNENGFLTDGRGNMVVCANGPVMIGDADFTVDHEGRIFRGGVYLDTLSITCPADYGSLSKADEGYYVNTGGAAGEFNFSVVQGSLERPNTNMAEEMTEIIGLSRHFQSCANVIKIFDEIMEKAANQVGKV